MKKFILILCLICFSVSAFADDVYPDNMPVSKNKAGETVKNIILSPFYLVGGVFNSIDNILNKRPGKIWESPSKKFENNPDLYYAELNKKQSGYERYQFEQQYSNLSFNTPEYKCRATIDKYGEKYNILTLSKPVQKKIIQVDDYYQQFLNDKNNMKNNRIIYDILKEQQESTDLYLKTFDSYDFQQLIDRDINYFKQIEYSKVTKNGDLVVQNGYNSKIDEREKFLRNNPCNSETIRIYNDIKDLNNKLHKINNEIYSYSENYEKQKFISWAQQNNKKMIDGRLSNYVYYAQTPAPKLGFLYKHVPAGDFYLKVLQSVPGGVILTGEYMGPYGPTGDGSIFLQTSKLFADGQIIKEGIVAEYKGFYDYYTVLGVKKRIYKFYRLGETEIKNNFEIPEQPFYFYLPY